jgi:hypothetical protein
MLPWTLKRSACSPIPRPARRADWPRSVDPRPDPVFALLSAPGMGRIPHRGIDPEIGLIPLCSPQHRRQHVSEADGVQHNECPVSCGSRPAREGRSIRRAGRSGCSARRWIDRQKVPDVTRHCPTRTAGWHRRRAVLLTPRLSRDRRVSGSRPLATDDPWRLKHR